MDLNYEVLCVSQVIKILIYCIVQMALLTIFFLDQTRSAPSLFYCLTPDDFTRQGRASILEGWGGGGGGRGNWAYLLISLP